MLGRARDQVGKDEAAAPDDRSRPAGDRPREDRAGVDEFVELAEARMSARKRSP
jgi:hypothetical protein